MQHTPPVAQSLVTSQAAAAAVPTTVVVQNVPASATGVTARGSGGGLTSPQSSGILDPLRLPDVQAAMMELRIKYEVEKAPRTIGVNLTNVRKGLRAQQQYEPGIFPLESRLQESL